MPAQQPHLKTIHLKPTSKSKKQTKTPKHAPKRKQSKRERGEGTTQTDRRIAVSVTKMPRKAPRPKQKQQPSSTPSQSHIKCVKISPSPPSADGCRRRNKKTKGGEVIRRNERKEIQINTVPLTNLPCSNIRIQKCHNSSSKLIESTSFDEKTHDTETLAPKEPPDTPATKKEHGKETTPETENDATIKSTSKSEGGDTTSVNLFTADELHAYSNALQKYCTQNNIRDPTVKIAFSELFSESPHPYTTLFPQKLENNTKNEALLLDMKRDFFGKLSVGTTQKRKVSTSSSSLLAPTQKGSLYCNQPTPTTKRVKWIDIDSLGDVLRDEQISTPLTYRYSNELKELNIDNLEVINI
jgi:hypothetical protein